MTNQGVDRMKKVTLEEVKSSYTKKNADFLKKCYMAFITEKGHEEIGTRLNLEVGEVLNQKIDFFAMQYMVWNANEQERNVYKHKLQQRNYGMRIQDALEDSFYHRYCFWLCIATEWDKKMMTEKNIFEVQPNTVMENARRYLLKATKQEEDLLEQLRYKIKSERINKKPETEEEYIKTKGKSKQFRICNELISNPELTEIILKNNNINDITEVKRLAKVYVENYRNAGFIASSLEFETKLEKVIERCYKFLVENKEQESKWNELKNKQDLKFALPFIKDYCSQNTYISVEDFYSDYKKKNPELTLSLYRIKTIVQLLAPDIYEQYKIKIDRAKSIRFKMIVNQMNQILSAIIYGVKENEQVRQFNLLDYFKLTNVEVQEIDRLLRKDLSSFLNKYTVDEIKKIKQFMKENQEKTKLTICQSITKVVDGNTYTMNELRQKQLSQTLIDMKIPIYQKVFSLAITAELNGTLKNQVIINYPLEKKFTK